MRESAIKVYSNLSLLFRENEKWIRDILLGGFLFFTLLSVVFHVKSNIEVPTYHIDGAFQTASSLFRLDAGHSVGKDFFPYLGIGIVYTLYPFYKLFGGDLMATTQAASFVCILVGALIVAIPVSLLRKSGNFRTLVFVFSLFLFLFLLLGSQPCFYWLADFLKPGVSLRLLRSALPYMVFFLVFLLLRQTWRDWIKTTFLGFLAGISFLWSNDFAIPTVGVLFGVSLLVFMKNGWKSLPYHALSMSFVFAFSAFAIGMIVCRGHYLDFLCYNFRDVAGDQFWYFAGYLAHHKILTFSDFMGKVILPLSLYLFLLPLLVLVFVKTRKIQWLLVSAIGVVSLTSLSLVQVAGHMEIGYRYFFYIWAAVTLVAIIVQFPLRVRFRYTSGFLCLFAVLSVGLFLASWRDFNEATDAAKLGATQNSQKTNLAYVPEFGGVIKEEFVPYLNMARQNASEECLEEYWGLWGALNRRFDNPKVDSIIHARGSVEFDWIEKIQKKPDVVITSRPVSPMLLSAHLWSVNVNYYFYSFLLRNYTPVFESPTTLVWKRLRTPNEFPAVPVSVSEKTFILETNEAGFYEISCDIDFAFSRRNILLFNSGIHYVWAPFHPLNPRQKPHIFPAYFDGVNREFSFRTTPEHEPYRILSCTARRIVLNDERALPNPVEFVNLKRQNPSVLH